MDSAEAAKPEAVNGAPAPKQMTVEQAFGAGCDLLMSTMIKGFYHNTQGVPPNVVADLMVRCFAGQLALSLSGTLTDVLTMRAQWKKIFEQTLKAIPPVTTVPPMTAPQSIADHQRRLMGG